MKISSRKFTAEFKAKVAIEALKERQILAELSKKYELHMNQISKRKQEFIKNSSKLFSREKDRDKKEEVDVESLYTKIGRLEVERDYLKKT